MDSHFILNAGGSPRRILSRRLTETVKSGFHTDPFGSHMEDGPGGQRMESGILLATAHVQAGDSEGEPGSTSVQQEGQPRSGAGRPSGRMKPAHGSGAGVSAHCRGQSTCTAWSLCP